MDRRQFFKLGFLRIKDEARKRAPDIIRKEIAQTVVDVSILTSRHEEAEHLVDDLLREHFGERMLRLRQSRLEGRYPGGIVLCEDNAMRDYRDGASLFYAALSQLSAELSLGEVQTDPALLRYTNATPPFSRSVEVFRGDAYLRSIALSDEGTFEVEGRIGRVVFEVAAGRLQVVEAPCEHGTCKAHPPIITPGQRITCVPSEITVVVGAILRG